jgi:H+/Cl- antiporter ClcA
MGPSIIGTTLLSHLGGASVGREGTALQMGGALADQFSRSVNLDPSERRTLLLCGVSAGFAAVFGTPIAAAIFALEFVRVRSWAVLPCLACGFLADLVGQKLFLAHHANYRLPVPAELSFGGIGSALAIGLACGLVARLYVYLSRREAVRPTPEPYARIFFVGVTFSLMVYFYQMRDFTGLGLHVIDSALVEPSSPTTFIFKLLITLMCVGAGYRGGEVTPLFFIGATLGSAAAAYLGLPLAVCASLGFVAVFAGAGAVPLACTVMACELFGWTIGGYALLACAVSWLVAGRKGLYDEA